MQKAVEVAKYARDFVHARWSFLGPGDASEGFGTSEDKPSKGEIKCHLMLGAKVIPLERTPEFQYSYPLERGRLKCKRGKESTHFNADSSMRTMLAGNQLSICHAVSTWYNQVQKMHQSKPDFDLDLSDNDVTTLVQHVTPQLTWISYVSLGGTNICDETVYVIGKFGYLQRANE